MNTTEIKKLIQQELPNVLQTDKTFHYIIQGILQENFADKQKTDDRFEQMLAEIRTMREESERKWNKQQAENRAMREESERKWQEQKVQWDKQEAENHAMHEESKAQLDEIRAMREESQLFIRKYESSIGALGSRWGMQTEGTFRNALKSILEESFDMKVLNITEFDHKIKVTTMNIRCIVKQDGELWVAISLEFGLAA